MISLIVAMDRNRLIGKDGSLPWHIPEELKFFKETTTGHPIIMGRKTHESIKKALPKRTNIVLTRQENYCAAENCLVVSTPQEAVELAQSREGSDEIFIIGGSSIYEAFLPMADRLYITEIDESFEGDVYFPELSESWKVIKTQNGPDDAKHQFQVNIYEKSTF